MKTYNLTLTEQDLDIVMNALQVQQWRTVNNTISKIMLQVKPPVLPPTGATVDPSAPH